jgi:type 1 fimbria pilin
MGETLNMKAFRILSLAACAFLLAAVARAADETRTISGDAMCAKCELNLQDTCQTVIQVKEGDKVVNYFVAANDVAKAFHPKICHGPAQVTATGTVSTVDGKQVLTVTSIDIKK